MMDSIAVIKNKYRMWSTSGIALRHPGRPRRKNSALHVKNWYSGTGKKYLQPTTTTNGVNDQSYRKYHIFSQTGLSPALLCVSDCLID
jgi:hypothetical protein